MAWRRRCIVTCQTPTHEYVVPRSMPTDSPSVMMLCGGGTGYWSVDVVVLDVVGKLEMISWFSESEFLFFASVSTSSKPRRYAFFWEAGSSHRIVNSALSDNSSDVADLEAPGRAGVAAVHRSRADRARRRPVRCDLRRRGRRRVGVEHGVRPADLPRRGRARRRRDGGDARERGARSQVARDRRRSARRGPAHQRRKGDAAAGQRRARRRPPSADECVRVCACVCARAQVR